MTFHSQNSVKSNQSTKGNRMHESIDNLRPMNDDVILKHHSINKTSKIYIRENEEEDHSFRFEVLRIGNDVKHVSVGDIVIVPWPRCMSPFEVLVDGIVQKVTITSEKEILGVCDE